MKLTYYGHACFGVQLGGRNLLFDPFITPNPLAKNVKVNEVPADYIFISHGHQDHLADAAAIAARTGATTICNFEVASWLGKHGVQKVHPVNHGGSFRFDSVRVQYVPALHSSSLPDGSYGGNPGGFVVLSPDGNFYYSGDTALTVEMRLIGESHRLNYAILCIGDNFTMGVEDAIKAADFVGCREVLGVHYDTFPPIKIDHQEAMRQFEAAGKKLYLLEPGQSHNF